ncbi:Tfp pilus assembly protein PilN [Ereboglobus sp. PH5-10]|uniref:hypothetical protein n=1 Tax=Ereboglobus sp. PH5-10 TaxID=2940629 RepID=UPI0024075211|nr:hypothetical protein [Ereboglobus sp. PH5-10]MDF9828344.1 Tfp pilus assembly protein PilN [Ereboglobus sp. PH5-10]
MAKPQGLFIWEKTVYYNDPVKGWLRKPLVRLEDAVSVVQEHYKKKSSLVMAYDPDIMQTEFAECPGGGRPIVREALSGSHESIANNLTGWGFQQPWPLPGSGGSFGSFCSYETVPSLSLLRSSLMDVGYSVPRAFPLATLAMHASATPGRTSIFMIVDKDSQAFVYINTMSGMKACRKLYAGKRQEAYDVWSEISMVFGEYGVTFEDGGQRPQMRIYQAPGTDVKTQCPYWDVLQAQAQVEVMGFGALELLLLSVPGKHSSSLMEDMPKTIVLDFGLQIATAVLLVVFIGFGIFAYLQLQKDSKTIKALTTQQNALTAQKVRLEKNKGEMENLQKLYAKDIFEYSSGRVQLIQMLPVAIPREGTLTSVNISGETFRLAGIFWKMNTTQPKTADTTDPTAAIKRTLEGSIPGLLVNQGGNKYTDGTGDFIVEGTTPKPSIAGGGKN